MGTPSHILAPLLDAAAAIGILIAAAQLVVLRRHLRCPPAASGWPAPSPIDPPAPPISILKPLCGVDDQLEENLRCFADLPYPRYEVLLGVRGTGDAAYPIAAAAALRWPARFRVVIQAAAPGLNPKVNQLIALLSAARYDLIVISDSNTRVGADYLAEIAARLGGDPGVGLVTHPIAGSGERAGGACLGSLLDNLHLTGTITPGIAAARQLCGKSYVVGKSMAMRRRDVEALGGFEAVKDVLAEDFVLGRLVAGVLGKRVVLGRSIVECISVRHRLPAFLHRYARWSVMQRQCAGLPAYLALLLLNPILLGLAALALAPSALTAGALAACALSRMAADAMAGRLLRGRGFAAHALLWVPLKDLLAGAAWCYGLVRRSIEWRANHLIVLRGSVLRLALSSARARTGDQRRRGFGRGRTSAAA
jgi:ceramide glucosyltransferase